MKMIYGNHMKKLLPPLFKERFPDFKRVTPKIPGEWKGLHLLPLATTFFLRIDGMLWQGIGIRRSSHEDILPEIYWSFLGQWPWARMTVPDFGRSQDAFLALKEGHASFVQILPPTVPRAWAVWECSVPPSHPEYIDRYVREIAIPVTDSEAEAAVRKALGDLMDAIEEHVLLFFEKLRAKQSA